MRLVPKALPLALISLGLFSCATVQPPVATPATPEPPAASAADAAKPAAPGEAQTVSAGGPSTAARPPAVPAAPGTPPPPRPFADVSKDAKSEAGFFTTWVKDDKVWLEIPEDMWGKPFFFSVNVTNGIGDAGMYGNQMGGYLAAGRGQYLASFNKIGSNGVQLIAHNTAYIADDKTPAKTMLDRAFSDSLIGYTTVSSAAHPERKSVLIDATAMLLNDFPGAAGELERTFRQGYAFDAKNSTVSVVPNNESETGFSVRAHYQLPKIALPSPAMPPTAPRPTLPSTLPDVRSLFMGYYYGFSKMPEPMRPRVTDPRVGYFSTTVSDFTDPDRRDVRNRYINRWRLEKKDNVAAGQLSEPKEPIVFWLDKNIPIAYREAVTKGVLMWNQAYEQIGFKNAVVVKQQQEGDTFDTSATRYASIRWVAGKSIRFGARGPSKTDPRTGEILDADIEVNEEISRIYTGRTREDPPRPISAAHAGHQHIGELCEYEDSKLNETAFGLDLLVARGELSYGSPEALDFVRDAVTDIIAHEVGHTLGLRHNFRASLAITPDQLKDSKYGATNGISASVMDYNALNLATNNEPQGQYSMVTLGAYDRWAIEYGYQVVPSEQEAAALAKTLSRAMEPQHAYATDEDAGFGSLLEGIDPEVNRSDLSADPLAFYDKRFTVVRELWDRWQNKSLPAGTQYEVLRRNFDRGFNLINQVSELTTKYIGGIRVLRDPAGTGRQPLTPTDVAQQRRALNILTKNLFEVNSFQFKPEFIGSLVPDFESRFDAVEDELSLGNPAGLDYSVANRVLSIQRAALNTLYRDTVAARILSAPEKTKSGQASFNLSELYGTVQKAVWSELGNGAEISPMRRNLQKEHTRMVAEMLTRANPRLPADARSLQRQYAVDLLAQLRRAIGRSVLSVETRAHLNESIALIDSALKAQITKAIG